MIEGGAKSFGRRTFHPEDRQDREETYLYNPQTCRPRASDHTLLSKGILQTKVTDTGRLAWTDGTGPPEINLAHHADELLAEQIDLRNGGASREAEGTPL